MTSEEKMSDVLSALEQVLDRLVTYDTKMREEQPLDSYQQEDLPDLSTYTIHDLEEIESRLKHLPNWFKNE